MTPLKPFAVYRDTRLWNAVAKALEELESTREISIATAPEYVIGYLCERLTDRHLVAPAALLDEP